jgi:hypothetical protein
MSFYDQNRPFGAPIGTREAPPVEGLSWSEAAYYKRINGDGSRAPAMCGMTLAQLEAKAREETWRAREAQEAREGAHRERAQGDRAGAAGWAVAEAGPAGPARLAAQGALSQPGALLHHAREAAACVGIDEHGGAGGSAPEAHCASPRSSRATGRMPTT